MKPKRRTSVRKLRLIASISSALVIPPFLFADAPATTQSSDTIGVLIHQLSADSWQQRQAAQDRLVMLGDEARERLVRASKDASDDETRSRAEAAIVQIDENHATGPSVINLHLKDVS